MSKYVDGIHEERFDLFLGDLRSGEYEQGKGYLERNGKFCCLGVACIRPAAEGVVSREPNEHDSVAIAFAGNTAEMPKEVADYLGIPAANRTGVYYTNILLYKTQEAWDGETQSAIGLNDDLHKSFAEIADAFELEFTKEA